MYCRDKKDGNCIITYVGTRIDTDSLACKRSLELTHTVLTVCSYISTCTCTSCSQSLLPSHQHTYFTGICIMICLYTHMRAHASMCLHVCLSAFGSCTFVTVLSPLNRYTLLFTCLSNSYGYQRMQYLQVHQ